MTADFSTVQSRQISSGKNRKICFSDCSEKEQTVYKNPRRNGKLSAIVAKKQLEKIYFLQIIELSVAEIQNADLYF